jgi:hypothetical protein
MTTLTMIMTMTTTRRAALAALGMTAALGVPMTRAAAQDLAARVAAVRDGRVQLLFTAREGTCGDGRTFVRVGNNTYVGTWNGGMETRHNCAPGPVRVVARVRDGVVDDVRHYVGPVPARDTDVTDLGTVPAPVAARWLMDVAKRSPTRAASKAIVPAMLADSAIIWRDLLAIARDADTRSRDVRREAANWLSHFASAAVSGRKPGELDFETGVGAPGDHGKDSDEVETKKAAVFALSQLRDNTGVPQLVTVARTNKDPEVRRSALFWLGQSGDPRGLAVFEEVLSR